MDQVFERMVSVVLKHEGGYVHDPNDPGGETKYGISKRAYPDLDIKNLTVEQAREIYYRDYYLKVKADKIPDKQLALELFDMAVNAGVAHAVMMLQELVHTRRDGVFGPKTLSCVKGYPQRAALLWKYKYKRLQYYIGLVRKNPALSRFLHGWANRVEQTKLR
jgi:lysozyme family protein